MPKLSFINSLLRREKHPIPSDALKAGPVLNVREGENVIVLYTSASDKMKIFSAFIREGLESGDRIEYDYPDEENEIVRAKLKEHGINVEAYEKAGSLDLGSLTDFFMTNGKLDLERAIIDGLNGWAEAKSKGFKHVRSIEDYGDFSFIDGKWQKFITDFWNDPRWADPNISKWVTSNEPAGIVFSPFLMEITAINVERMTETQVTELLKAMGKGKVVPARSIDLLENMDSFSKLIDWNHERLVGRRILLEFDPSSNYEKVIDSLAKESMANVEPIYVFTSSTSPIHSQLADQPAIKFFLTSISTSTPQSSSENEVLLPAKNTALILDATNKVLETYGDANICVVFDILSELLATIGEEKTFTFLRYALDLLSSEKTTSLFLLNTSAHDAEVVSRLRNLFSNQLAYDRNGLKVVKTF